MGRRRNPVPNEQRCRFGLRTVGTPRGRRMGIEARSFSFVSLPWLFRFLSSFQRGRRRRKVRIPWSREEPGTWGWGCACGAGAWTNRWTSWKRPPIPLSPRDVSTSQEIASEGDSKHEEHVRGNADDRGKVSDTNKRKRESRDRRNAFAYRFPMRFVRFVGKRGRRTPRSGIGAAFDALGFPFQPRRKRSRIVVS